MRILIFLHGAQNIDLFLFKKTVPKTDRKKGVLDVFCLILLFFEFFSQTFVQFFCYFAVISVAFPKIAKTPLDYFNRYVIIMISRRFFSRMSPPIALY
jgi:hypothetical protein